MLRADISAARGKAMLVETTASGWGDGKTAAPQQDWKQSRLGPSPPEIMAMLRRDAFAHVLAATGTPPALFVDNADGTSQREAIRRWHLGTVLPLAKLIEHELKAKLETEVRLKFDAYPIDLAGRASAFTKLVAGGVAVNEALVTSGLLGGLQRRVDISGRVGMMTGCEEFCAFFEGDTGRRSLSQPCYPLSWRGFSSIS